MMQARACVRSVSVPRRLVVLSARAKVFRIASAALSRGLHISRAAWDQPESTPSIAKETFIQPTDLLALYRGLVARGDIEYDEAQVRAVMRLRRLTRELEDYVPNLVSGHAVPAALGDGTSWWTPQRMKEEGMIDPDTRAVLVRRDMANELAELPFPKGVILIAPPGRGKTFLLDMWFSSLPTKHKVRKHYSTLTLELYRAVWEETQYRAAGERRRRAWTPASVAGPGAWSAKVKARWRALFDSGDMSLVAGVDGGEPGAETKNEDEAYVSELPMAQVLAARLLLRQGWLLHIDELQLLDIGSATILSDVLAHFWRMGGMVVATSNKVPGELYKNGLGAERVRGFVSALEARCDVVVVGGEQDWRRAGESEDAAEGIGASRMKSWYLAGDEDRFEDAVREVVKDRKQTSMTLNIFSRQLHIPQVYLATPTSPPIARLTFEHVCNTALGTADYTTLASTFSTLILTDIPILRLSTKDRARRFIMLVDALYEARVRVVCLAEAPIDGLFFPDELAGMGEGIGEDQDNARTMMEEALSEGNVAYRPNVSVYQPEQEETRVDAEAEKEKEKQGGLALRELSIFTGQEEKFAYARATSRLVQMTSAKYAANVVWQPLSRVHQPWHRDPIPTPSSSPTDTHATTPETSMTDSGDWAEEASYDARRGRNDRPAPPRLSANHAWGVREDWGTGAGEWGKGAAGKVKGSEDGGKS